MRVIDLSQPVFDECPNSPAHPAVKVDMVADHPWEGWRVERVNMAVHTGSHITVPFHRFRDGRRLDDYVLNSFTGKAFLLDFRRFQAVQPISAANLQAELPDTIKDAIVLLGTGWGAKRGHTREWLHYSPFLAPDGAHWLVERGVRAVGIDHYSIGGAREPENTETQEILLKGGLWLVEDMNFPDDVWRLRRPFEFWALPINLKGFSGSPCRPVAVSRF